MVRVWERGNGPESIVRDSVRIIAQSTLLVTAVLLTNSPTGQLLLLSVPSSQVAAWIGIVLYGFGNGPCVGYCYDINNRIVLPPHHHHHHHPPLPLHAPPLPLRGW